MSGTVNFSAMNRIFLNDRKKIKLNPVKNFPKRKMTERFSAVSANDRNVSANNKQVENARNVSIIKTRRAANT